MDDVLFLEFPCHARQQWVGKMYYNHGTAQSPIPPLKNGQSGQEGEGERFNFKLNIYIVVHALLCKVLPDNCTCVNTLNADFVLKKKTDVD